MAISAEVKVGYIDLDPVRDAVIDGCSNRIGFSEGHMEEKIAYINRIARISVGDFEPQVEYSSENESVDKNS